MNALRLLGGAAVAMIVAFGWSAQGGEPSPMGDAQKAAIETVIHDYLVAHPEVLVEAMAVLRDREQQAENDSQQKAITEHQNELLHNPDSPVLGNPNGDVTIVEFFDYACPYCKSVETSLATLVKTDGKIRLVLKEFPVLGANSVRAAKAALAARAQGKFEPFHQALLETHGQLNEETILRIAKSVGLDTERLKTDMEASSLDSELKANLDLADALAIHGTPAFVINGEIYPGAIDLPAMQRAVVAARKG